MSVSARDSSIPALSDKFRSLVLLLLTEYRSQSSAFRGIIFVQCISLTYPLCTLLNSLEVWRDLVGECAPEKQPWLAVPLSGVQSMTEGTRSANLAAFRSGSAQLLVSTCAAEEGIDVPECTFVVRFDSFCTAKSHIQGSGRARHQHAKVR